MQRNVNGEEYDERKSKDERYEYTITGNHRGYDVDCWVVATGDNHWNKWFPKNKRDAAIAEFNRFE